MIETDVLKDQLHTLVHAILDKNNGEGIVALCTGAGKTKCGMEYLVPRVQDEILWAVPTEELRDDTVPAEFEKWGHIAYFDKWIETICYASMHKIKGKHFKYVVLDEAHMLTELRSEFFDNNTVERILCLTATKPEDEEKQELLYGKLKMKIVYELSLEEGVAKGIIAPFDIFLYGLELDDKTVRKIPLPRNRSIMRTEKRHYDIANQYFTSAVDTRDRREIMNAAIGRKRALTQCRSKLEAAQEFIKKHVSGPGKRTLFFCGSIANANDLSRYRHHSRSKTHYDKFQDKQIHELATVQAANQGLNFKDLDRVIITQVDAKKLKLIQRIGRVVRLAVGKRAQVIIFYYKNTVDEKWVRELMTQFKTTKIYDAKTDL